jgi:5-formyltetrahydrofolate cyclo-ligase
MTTDTASTKQSLRHECKRIRSAMTPEMRYQACAAICQHIEGWRDYQESNTVLTYMAMRSEIDLSALCNRHPQKTWAIPRIRPGGQMVFHTYDPSKLVKHAYGMLEPDPDCPDIAPQAIQLALVPGLAFDGDGWRLGYGGGFYDRFLLGFKGISAGITYQALLLKRVTHAQHDIPMRFVITETGVFSTSEKNQSD